MRYKLAISTLAVVSLLGATAIASAQMQPAPGASSEGSVRTEANKSNMKPGTTTGSATTGSVVTKGVTNKGVARNPSTDNDAGIGRGK